MAEVEIEFPQDMVEEIEAIIAETGERFSDFVNSAIEQALRDLDEEDASAPWGTEEGASRMPRPTRT